MGPATRNAASQRFEQGLRYFNAGDFDRLLETLEPDFVSDDRRRLVARGDTRTARDWLASLRAAVAVGYTKASSTIVATRGDHFALVRTTFETDEGASTDQLNVMVFNEHGRAVRGDVLDDDVEAALAHLEDVERQYPSLRR